MLKGIKAIINERKSFTEAADLILEDEQLDDSIILGEEGPEEESENDTDKNCPDCPEGEGLDLPDPVGSQTGEPAEIAAADLLGIELDLATNTQADTLPIPPSNAVDAIADNDDIMDQRVDAGFGGDGNSNDAPTTGDGDDLMGAPIDDDHDDDDKSEHKDESTSLFDEAITVGTDPAPAADAGTDPVPDAPADAGEVPADDPAPAEEDNAVTSAVKDKVAEMDAEDPTISADGNAAKEALLKKLGNLTKGLEDAKKAVMDSIR